jgi:hypothetical protein
MLELNVYNPAGPDRPRANGFDFRPGDMEQGRAGPDPFEGIKADYVKNDVDAGTDSARSRALPRPRRLNSLVLGAT